jgi:uncharacterized phage protein gp47/JayE
MASVDANGLLTRTKEEILAEIYERWRTKPDLGEDFLSSPDTPQAQIAEPIAEMLAELEEALAALTAAYSRSQAYSQWLDDAGDRIGVPRQQPTRSTVVATVNLNAGITLAAGSQAADATDAEEIYRTTADVSNTTSAAGNFTVTMEAVTAGTSTFVAAGQLTAIVTPVAGWNSVTNAADAEPGTDLESDADYRERQQLALVVAGSGTVDAIRSAIVTVSGVDSVSVLENTTSAIDGDGVPPHAFEAVVLGGGEDDIAQAIWDNKPAGIYSAGTVTSGIAFDALGVSHNVRFSRPTSVPIWMDLVLNVDEDYPGHTAFKEAVVAEFGGFHGLGQDVIRTRLYDLIFNVAGIEDVTTLELGTASAPSGTSNIAIAARQLAVFDTSRLTVTAP